jgi:hypothetical protein
MAREEGIDSDEDIGVLQCGKRFRYSKKETVVGKEEKHKEFKESDPYDVLHITPYKERKRKERDPLYCLAEEGSPSEIRICIEPTTPCASLRSEAGIESSLTIVVVSGGSQRNS